MINPRVLVVDDQPGEARPLIAFLEQEGFDVVFTTTGSEALAVLAREWVQAVICDLEMLGLDGYGVLEAVGLNPNWRHLPFMLANPTWDASNWSLRAGGRTADCHFIKPYCAREVASFLGRMLRSVER